MVATEWITILNTIISTVLTGFLVLLYYRQTGIQESQQELMEIEQSPNIEIDDWGYEWGEFEFTISNHGGGAATSMFVDVSLLTRQGEMLYGGTAPLILDNSRNGSSFTTSLPSHQRQEGYKLDLEMTPVGDDVFDLSLSEVLADEHESSEHDYLYLHMDLVYETSIQGRCQERVIPYPVFVRKENGWGTRSEISDPEPGDQEPGVWHPFS